MHLPSERHSAFKIAEVRLKWRLKGNEFNGNKCFCLQQQQLCKRLQEQLRRIIPPGARLRCAARTAQQNKVHTFKWLRICILLTVSKSGKMALLLSSRLERAVHFLLRFFFWVEQIVYQSRLKTAAANFGFEPIPSERRPSVTDTEPILML